MDETEDLRAARAMRRVVLGDAYVDAQASDPNPVMREFQDHLTSMAWGVWTREGALSVRDRSLLVLAMTAALGRMEEFRLHAGASVRDGRERRRARRAAVPDRGLLRRAGRGGGEAGAAGRAGRTAGRRGMTDVAGPASSVSSASGTWAAPSPPTSWAGLDVRHPRRGRTRAQPRGRHVRRRTSPPSPARADVVVLSLPDGSVSEQVAGEIAGAADRRTTHVVDTSTVGVAAARSIDALLADAGVGLRRRPGVGRRGRGPRPHAVRDGRRVRRRRARPSSRCWPG